VGTSTGRLVGHHARGASHEERWAETAAKAEATSRPTNIVVSSAVQVCWEKAARYFDIEEKYVCCTEQYVLDRRTANLCGKHHWRLLRYLGTTYAGEYEDVQAEAMDRKEVDVPIHVDATNEAEVRGAVRRA